MGGCGIPKWYPLGPRLTFGKKTRGTCGLGSIRCARHPNALHDKNNSSAMRPAPHLARRAGGLRPKFHGGSCKPAGGVQFWGREGVVPQGTQQAHRACTMIIVMARRLHVRTAQVVVVMGARVTVQCTELPGPRPALQTKQHWRGACKRKLYESRAHGAGPPQMCDDRSHMRLQATSNQATSNAASPTYTAGPSNRLCRTCSSSKHQMQL